MEPCRNTGASRVSQGCLGELLKARTSQGVKSVVSSEHVAGLHSAIMVLQGVDGVACYALKATKDSKDNIEQTDGNDRC